MLIYDGVKPIQPRYHIVTDDATYCVEAYCCEILRMMGLLFSATKIQSRPCSDLMM